VGLPLRILAHTATPVRVVEDADSEDWVEGEPDESPDPVAVDAEAFPCILFLPNAPSGDAPEQTWKPSRVVSQPTVLYDPKRLTGEQPKNGEVLRVRAPELEPFTGGVEVDWTVDSDPQPFGPPGRQPVGVQVTLKRVTV